MTSINMVIRMTKVTGVTRMTRMTGVTRTTRMTRMTRVTTILAKRFWDTSPSSRVFFMEFTANLPYTLINMTLTRFFPHLLRTKLRSLAYAKYVKSLTCNTQHCSGGRGST